MQEKSNGTTEMLNNNLNNSIQIETSKEKEKILTIFEACLGEIDFYKIKNFFLDLVQGISNTDSIKNIVVIFATRRCHVLFYLFYNFIFTPEEKEFFGKITIISDKAVELNSKELNGKCCKIVDDILIHGRSLLNIQKRVNNTQPKQILKYVYAINNNDNSNMFKTDYYSISINNNEWEKLSNNIVSLIIMMSAPYTSYVYSCSKKMTEEEFNGVLENFRNESSDNEFDEFCMDLSLNENKTETHSSIKKIINDNIIAKVFFYNGTEYNLKNLKPCIRVYYNKLLNKCLMIPFCFIGPLCQDSINSYIDTICVLDGFKDFSDSIKNSKLQTQYRLIQTIFSYAFGVTLFKDYNNWEPLCNQIDSSYFKDFYNKALKGNCQTFLNKDNCEKLFNSDINAYKEYSIKNILTENPYSLSFRNNVYIDTLIDKLQEKEDTDFSIEGYINEYQSKVHINEETGYSEGKYKEKQIGVPVSFLETSIKLFNENINVDFQFYGYIIQSMDTGLFALYPELISDCTANRCEEFLTTGEQVCRLLNIPNNVLLRDITELLINRNRLSQENTKDEYLDTVLTFIADNGGNATLIKSLKKNYKSFPQPRMILNLVQGTQNDDSLKRIYVNGLENI